MLIMFLALLTLTMTNPHAPKKLTWQVVSATGDAVWSTTHTAPPGTWWPSLHPDVCQLVAGLDTWDIPDISYDQIALRNPGSGWGVFSTNDWYGCRNPQFRCFLRQSEFYVCPKDGRSASDKWRCGGPESFYCKAWGGETTGAAYWKPSSQSSWISVGRNFTPNVEDCPALGTYPCSSIPLCMPLNITFTEQGKKASIADWIKGRTWGLRFYVSGSDPGLMITIRLRVETLHPKPMGPNSVLKEQGTPSSATPSSS